MNILNRPKISNIKNLLFLMKAYFKVDERLLYVFLYSWPIHFSLNHCKGYWLILTCNLSYKKERKILNEFIYAHKHCTSIFYLEAKLYSFIHRKSLYYTLNQNEINIRFLLMNIAIKKDICSRHLFSYLFIRNS